MTWSDLNIKLALISWSFFILNSFHLHQRKKQFLITLDREQNKIISHCVMQLYHATIATPQASANKYQNTTQITSQITNNTTQITHTLNIEKVTLSFSLFFFYKKINISVAKQVKVKVIPITFVRHIRMKVIRITFTTFFWSWWGTNWSFSKKLKLAFKKILFLGVWMSIPYLYRSTCTPIALTSWKYLQM